VKIRAYRDDDLDDVVRLWDACGLNVPHNDPADDIALVRRSPNAALLLAHAGPRLVGTVLVGHDGHRGWMYRLAVSPERQRGGLGRMLVEHAEDWLAARGLRKLNLMIRPDNTEVRAFYERVGYEETPRLVMARWLHGDNAIAGRRRHLAVTVTHLEMTAPPKRAATPPPGLKLALLRAEPMPVGFYRYLYDAVGAPWLWSERRLLDDAALQAVVADPKVEIFVLYVAGVPAGFFELDRRTGPDIELTHIGLLPDFIGRGLGRHLVSSAIDAAWQHSPQRLTARTRSLDHPRAFTALQRAGFVPVRQETMQIEDPRAGGLIPAEVAAGS
jgi:ribosomal protein S18 acetylase RimI-like enzyme